MSKNFKGSLFLISAALVWGLAFVAQKNAAGSIGVFSYIMCRSVVTCAVLIPLCLIRGRGLKRYAPMGPALRRGLVMGVLTFGAISLQQWGMEYTSASKSGFVTALYIVLVPLLGLFFGKKPGLKVWLAVAIALTGAALLSLDFSESLLPGPGEALTFGCALVFSLHILYVDHRAQHLDSTLMCAIQFGVCAVLGGVGAIFEGLTFSQISGNLTSIPLCGRDFRRGGLHLPAGRTKIRGTRPGLAAHVPGKRVRRVGRLAHRRRSAPAPGIPGLCAPACGLCGRPAAPAQEDLLISKTGLHGSVFSCHGQRSML